jgi:hypothetical protein
MAIWGENITLIPEEWSYWACSTWGQAQIVPGGLLMCWAGKSTSCIYNYINRYINIYLYKYINVYINR